MLIDLLEAVVHELNQAELVVAVKVQRAYLPRWKLQESSQLQVRVCLKEIAQEPVDRGSSEIRVDVWIALARHVRGEGETEDLKAADRRDQLDRLVYLVEQIMDHFANGRRLEAYDAAACVGVTVEPAYDPEQLDGKDLFFALMTVGFIVHQGDLA